MQDDKLWTVALTERQLDAIKLLADEAEWVELGTATFRTVPLGSAVLIDSSGASGWMVAVDRWTGLHGTEKNLEAVCRSLCEGNKRSREIAGLIKRRALAQGAPAESWPGEAPTKRKHKPRGMADVADAWRAGKSMKGGNVRTDGSNMNSWSLSIGETVGGKKVALDYRSRISGSTTCHCREAVRVADEVRQP